MAWESAFLNNIRDRKLSFKLWSYGLCGIQVRTAGYFYPDITGRDLIEHYNLNVALGAMQMNRLIALTGSLSKAEEAYNRGLNGMTRGGGSEYSKLITATEAKWIKFKHGTAPVNGP